MLYYPWSYRITVDEYPIPLNGKKTMTNVTLSVTPAPALIDDRLFIRIKGLDANQDITVHVCNEDDNGVRFESYGCFRANIDGNIDISKDRCIQGTYKGIDAMGLFWSMQAEPGFEKKRFLKQDVTTPLVAKVFVYKQFVTLQDLHAKTLTPLLTSEIYRWYKAADVSRVEVHENAIRGMLFIPPGKGPFPAVIDMFGGVGNLVEIRAALLASRGFLTLALGYLAYKDLPSTLDWLTSVKIIHYFKEAVDWMASHPLAMHGGIGVVGVSLGASYSNACTIISDKVVASVLISGLPYLFFPESYLNSEHQDGESHYTHDSWKGYEMTSEGVVTRGAVEHNEKYYFKSWDTKARYLVICGEDDQCDDPEHMARWYSKWPTDQQHRITLINYKDAGHLIEPPYSPLNRVSFAKYLFRAMYVWGGKPEGHAHAQEDSWKKILEFLKDAICYSNPKLTVGRL